MVKRPSLSAPFIRHRSWIYALILLVFLAVTVLGAVPRGLSVRRQLLVFWLPVVLLAAWALLELNRSRLAMATLVLSLALAGWTAFGPALEDWRGAAGYVTAASGPDDMVFLTTTGLLAFEYYNYEATPYAGAYLARIDVEDLPTDGRVWLVVNNHPAFQSSTKPLLTWFGEHRQLVGQHSFSQFIVVYEYSSQDSDN